MSRRPIFSVLFAAGLAACSSGASNPTPADSGVRPSDADAGLPADSGQTPPGTDAGAMDQGPIGGDLPAVSRTLALGSAGTSLWVTNPDSDSISEIDLGRRSLKREILLGARAPAIDASGRFDPAIRPRALAVVSALGKIYVAGQASNRIVVVDETSGVVTASIAVGAEPTAVVATRDGASLFVVSHQAALVQKIDTTTNRVTQSAPVAEHPFGASLSADERSLYVTHLLIGTGVTVLRTDTLETSSALVFPKRPPDRTRNKLLPSGESRGAYAAVPRPGTGELWVPHLLLATETEEPALDFQSTVFPSIAVLDPGGARIAANLDLRPNTVLTATGAFTDVVSGPRDVAFTPDGQVALVANAQSEDVMVFDAEMRFEIGLVRPTPSALIEGILVVADGADGRSAHAYVQGRSTHNLTVLAVVRSTGRVDVTVDGPAIDTLLTDPMPADIRRGERLFYSSNSAAFPITQNFWVACASCHLEGQSDAVVWRFTQGPRDTPSNAGGPINTGFLLRQATRNSVVDYDETIRTEQGGSFHKTNAAQLPDLDALAKFVNFAIPFPQNPFRNADGSLTAAQARGKSIFEAVCSASCHSGLYLTDSGSGNPTLDLSGPVVLHDVGTCVKTGAFVDQPAMDVQGHPRTACDFDTPTLRGVFATAPYFHDGSAATLDEVVARLPVSAGMTQQERDDIVAYLKTL